MGQIIKTDRRLLGTQRAELTWMDRRGAGRAQYGTLATLTEKMKTLRCAATLRLEGEEAQIGGVDRGDGIYDDKRIKWVWWFEAFDA